MTIDPALATIIVTVIVSASGLWQSYMLAKIHTLTNSNFSEAKNARLVAENALKLSEALNVRLQRQLNIKPTIVLASPLTPSV